MNVTFDELCLHVEAKQELGTPFRLIPNQEGNTQQFLRIRKDDDLPETKNACVSKVVVQMVHEFQQKLRHRITGIPDDVFSYDLGERLMLGRNTRKLDNALIAWHKEHGKQLEQAEVEGNRPFLVTFL